MADDFKLEGLEMNEHESDRFLNDRSDNNKIKVAQAPLEYCDVCFIAFGSQEPRVYKDSKVVHEDCAKRA